MLMQNSYVISSRSFEYLNLDGGKVLASKFFKKESPDEDKKDSETPNQR